MTKYIRNFYGMQLSLHHCQSQSIVLLFSISRDTRKCPPPREVAGVPASVGHWGESLDQRQLGSCHHFVHSDSNPPSEATWCSHCRSELVSAAILAEVEQGLWPSFVRSSRLGGLFPLACCPERLSRLCC